MDIEFKRNQQRYQFLKWGMQAFNGFRVVPPGIGIVHQVNLEYLARGVLEKDGIWYPDTLVGTDSHTTMINGLGIVGWGVGGIEAEAGMLGQPVYFLTPDVSACISPARCAKASRRRTSCSRSRRCCARRRSSASSWSIFGDGAASLRGGRSRDDRQHGAGVRRDDGLLPGRRRDVPLPARSPAARTSTSTTFRNYYQAQGMFGIPRRRARSSTRRCSSSISRRSRPSVAGPKRPQDRIELDDAQADVHQHAAGRAAEWLRKDGDGDRAQGEGHDRCVGQRPADHRRRRAGRPVSSRRRKARNTSEVTESEMVNNRPTPDRVSAGALAEADEFPMAVAELQHGDVLIAAITSCTNTSNPSVMLAAGLLAKKAVEKGLNVPRVVKTSLAPGSRVVTEYYRKAGLQPYLDQLGFNTVGYGCTTCIGNSGPLDPRIEDVVTKHDLIARVGALRQPQLRSARASERSRRTSSCRRRWSSRSRSPAASTSTCSTSRSATATTARRLPARHLAVARRGARRRCSAR